MCDRVEALFNKEIPERVWHYTTVRALEGILTSGRMWATDARFTNDQTEFIHARDIADGCIESLQIDGEIGGFPATSLRDMLAHAFDEGALSPLQNQVYLISFSQAPDLLTQWIQYAAGGTGVSIAFDLRYIRPPNEAGIAITFAPCVYYQAEKEQLVRSCFARWTKTIAAIEKQSGDKHWVQEQLRTWKIIDRIYGLDFSSADFKRVGGENMKRSLMDAWAKTLFHLLRVAGHCKEEAFFAEQEWRLALPRPTHRPSVDNPVKFRGPRGTVPYFESNLFREGNLPIVEIMVGPLCNEITHVTEVVRQHGYNCQISHSSVPLRDTRTI